MCILPLQRGRFMYFGFVNEWFDQVLQNVKERSRILVVNFDLLKRGVIMFCK